MVSGPLLLCDAKVQDVPGVVLYHNEGSESAISVRNSPARKPRSQAPFAFGDLVQAGGDLSAVGRSEDVAADGGRQHPAGMRSSQTSTRSDLQDAPIGHESRMRRLMSGAPAADEVDAIMLDVLEAHDCGCVAFELAEGRRRRLSGPLFSSSSSTAGLR